MFLKNDTNKQNITIEQEMSDGSNQFIVEVREDLKGCSNPQIAENLFYIENAGLKMRQVKILLNGAIKTEAGALYYSHGNIQSDAKMGGVTGVFKKVIKGAITNESAIKPLYQGRGEIVLEPSFKHYIMVYLDNETIIVDKGMFYCCSGEIDANPLVQKNVSSAFLGNEGVFQLKLSGTGVVVLESAVPQSELIRYELNGGETLKVDGNFAIIRSAGVFFEVTKSDKSLLGSALNGEGFLNTFTGEGEVWLAPTAPIYNQMYVPPVINNNGMNNLT